MKFKLLSIGQKFEYQGDVYVKTSPLIASNVKSSHNKMIPRYAILNLLDDSGNNTPLINNKTISSQETLIAFNLFYEKCITTLEEHGVLIPEIKNKLDQSRDEFTQSLL